VTVSNSAAQELIKNANMQQSMINALLKYSIFQKACNASVVTHEAELVAGLKPISFAQFANDYIESFIL
jgi:hypothetical protein